jgi:hypothetical protein
MAEPEIASILALAFGLAAEGVILPEVNRLENWTSLALIIDGDENEPKAGAATKSRFTEPQILAILKQGGSGVPVPDLCRELGSSNATDLLPKNSLVHNWKNRLYHPWLRGSLPTGISSGAHSFLMRSL